MRSTPESPGGNPGRWPAGGRGKRSTDDGFGWTRDDALALAFRNAHATPVKIQRAKELAGIATHVGFPRRSLGRASAQGVRPGIT